jgi:2-phospho-L-lactate guanylyltransferase
MPTIVVPYRGPGGKRRLAPLPEPARAALAAAMLADVLAAAGAIGLTVVVAPEEARLAAASGGAAKVVPDPGSGQGAAVQAGLAGLEEGPVLVVNADLPCATAADLAALLDALPSGGVALVEAADGTTNALALASPRLFRPLYGPGSADRFRALDVAVVRTVPIANLRADVDTLDDLHRLGPRLGPSTLRAYRLHARTGAAA